MNRSRGPIPRRSDAPRRRHRPFPPRPAALGRLLLATAALAGAGSAAGPVASTPTSTTVPPWIEVRRDELSSIEAPVDAATARFELAEEIAALRGGDGIVGLAPARRTIMLDLLAEAIELDERWAAPAVRLAEHVETDPGRRRGFERMRRSLSGTGDVGTIAARDRLAESRFLSAYRTGRIEAAIESHRDADLSRLLSDPRLEAALDGGGDRIARDLETGRVPILAPRERRRLVEFDRARLAPEEASFADAAWLDGWAPLPEVDATSLAAWLRSMGR